MFNFLRNCQIVAWQLHHGRHSPASYKGSSFSYLCQHLFFVFLVSAILVTLEQYLVVVSVCFSLVTDAEYLICLLTVFIPLSLHFKEAELLKSHWYHCIFFSVLFLEYVLKGQYNINKNELFPSCRDQISPYCLKVLIFIIKMLLLRLVLWDGVRLPPAILAFSASANMCPGCSTSKPVPC